MASRFLTTSLACLALVGCSLDTAPMAGQGRTPGEDGMGNAGSSGLGGTGGQFAGSGGSGGISTLPGTDSGIPPGPGSDGGPSPGDASHAADGSLDGSMLHMPAPGSPCMTDADCSSPGVERTCIAENALAPLLVLPGGYCSQFCDSTLACEPGATCVLIPLGSFPLLVCMEACTVDGDCRAAEGYTCNMAFSDTPVCSLAN